MKRSTRFVSLRFAAGTALTAALLSTVAAQPPGRPLPPHPDPLRRALDTNGDHELDADEIAKAAESLAKVDTDGDGRITRAELVPRPPAGGPGGGPGNREREGRPGPPDGRGPGGPPPGPDPERFVERVMSFDADGDGKLDRAEVEKFAEQMIGRKQPRDPDRFRREPPPAPRDAAPVTRPASER